LTKQGKVGYNYGFLSIYLDHVPFILKDSNYVVFANAKLMYLDIQKSPFHFENSWLILRFNPKWVAHMDNVKLKKKPVVINLGGKEASHKAFKDMERPIGRKIEKEKQKSK
jgi:hypothetical protein